MSQAKNILIDQIKTEWVFSLEPWEILVNGLPSHTNPKAYSFQIVNNHVITKETRFWHRKLGLGYENPVYESLLSDNATFIDKTLIFSTPHQEDVEEKLRLLADWVQECPTLAVPHYYRAFIHLERKEYKEFFSEANQFLFQDSFGTPAAMLRYYLAMTSLYIYKDADRAKQALLPCLMANPLMAEFWCLLGDIHYQQHLYAKAASFYENAMLLGNRRLKSDIWPMDLTKYKKYPSKMMDNCQRMLTGMKLLKSVSID
jgi:tetratricopeptide (TPR) repeat protein